MNDDYLKFYGQSPLALLLGYFLDYPDQSFYGGELSRKLRISAGAVHGVLTKLYKAGILKREQKGKTLLYSFNEQTPVARLLKISRTLHVLTGLVKELSPYVREIYLFGSSATGEYVSESDVDIAVIAPTAADFQKIEEVVGKYSVGRKIQLLLFTSLEWEALEANDPVFYQKVTKGINLYNQKIDEFKFQEVS